MKLHPILITLFRPRNRLLFSLVLFSSCLFYTECFILPALISYGNSHPIRPDHELGPFRLKYRSPECRQYALEKWGKHTAIIASGDTLIPRSAGGFGLQFVAFIHGIFMCYLFGWEQIVAVHVRQLFPKPFTTTDGIEVFPREKMWFRGIELGTFDADGSVECPLDDIGIAATVREEAWKWLPDVKIDESGLYIHVRGGDTMKPGKAAGWYGPPPCHYYMDAMGIDNRKAFVVSDAIDEHPCIAQMVESGATYVKKRPVLEDLARLVRSRRMVAGRSAFPMMAMLLSKPKEMLFAFASKYPIVRYKPYAWLLDRYGRFGTHYFCNATYPYEDAVLRNWQVTETQISMMKTTQSGCSWEYG
jgi:hypothetical protein